MPQNLALRMRPQTIDQVIGQKHLVGEGKIIRRMVEANMLSSMILYGPPVSARPRLPRPSQAPASLPFGPSTPPPTPKNASRKSLKRPNFQVVWS